MMLYGPFVKKSKQLSVFLHKGAPKTATKSRLEIKKEYANEKMKERSNDSNNRRGLTIDQKINIATYQLQKRLHKQMQNKQRLVALIAHESAISRQIEAAERRASMRCPKYHTNH